MVKKGAFRSTICKHCKRCVLVRQDGKKYKHAIKPESRMPKCIGSDEEAE